MIAANAAFLTVVLGFLALLTLLVALLVRRRLRQMASDAQLLAADCARLADTLPQTLARARTQLMDANSTAERGLWWLARFDERTAASRAVLAAGTAELDALRARLLKARSNVESIKAGLRMVIRAIELRRTILG